MLECKIRRKRVQCSEMFFKVMTLRKVDQRLRDAALVRAFVLECIGFWNKLALENILFNFRDQSSEKVVMLFCFSSYSHPTISNSYSYLSSNLFQSTSSIFRCILSFGFWHACSLSVSIWHCCIGYMSGVRTWGTTMYQNGVYFLVYPLLRMFVVSSFVNAFCLRWEHL